MMLAELAALVRVVFLSIQAQDFIEEPCCLAYYGAEIRFLSIQAQDFIEEVVYIMARTPSLIPEHSSSGLH